GEVLAGGNGYDRRTSWNVATGRELRDIANEQHVAFSLDGRYMATTDAAHNQSPKVRLWDGPRGEQLKTFDVPGGAYAPRFVGDGRLLVVRSDEPREEADGGIRARSVRDVAGIVWDVTTGRKVFHRAVPGHSPWALSSDGKLLASGEGVLTIREVASNKEVVRIPTRVLNDQIAFSPDHSRLAACDEQGDLHVWDATTGARLTTIAFRVCEPASFAFSPDGQRLATGGWSGQVYVWQMPPRDVPPPPQPQRESLWRDLASTDASTGQRAVRLLTAGGDDVVAMLRNRLAPVPRLEAAKVARLLAELDVDDFDRRE